MLTLMFDLLKKEKPILVHLLDKCFKTQGLYLMEGNSLNLLIKEPVVQLIIIHISWKNNVKYFGWKKWSEDIMLRRKVSGELKEVKFF